MRRHLDPLTVDRVLAAALVVAAAIQAWVSGGTIAERLAGIAVGIAVCGSVAARRRFPAAVGIGVQALLVAVAASSLTVRPAGPPVVVVGWFCALYALAAWTTRQWFLLGLAFFAATGLVPAIVSTSDASTVVPFTVVAAIVMVLVRVVVGSRDERLRLAERERDLRAREAVVEERARIARELHDAIAHNVSMMVLQAGAERRVVGAGQTGDVLATIEEIGRDALTEMRRLVGMLRSRDGGEDDLRLPQPGLDDLTLLVDQVRSAGLPVDLRIEGDRRPLPVGIELSAFRIVQEALTNALKHAGNAQAAVRVRYGTDLLELEIVDDGAGPPADIGGGGHGLAGMRERVVLYGGRLDAGLRETGGFGVRVLLPIR